MCKSLLSLILVPALLAACGGDEPSADDRETVQVILRSDAAVQRAAGPLYLCLPEEAACYRKAGPGLVNAVEHELGVVDAALEETDDECLEETARAFRDSLAAYSQLGRAAADGDTTSADDAVSETTRLEIAFAEKLLDCGYSEGARAELARRLTAVHVDLLRLGEEVNACRTDACVLDVAARMEAVAVEGQSALDDVESMVDDDPACLSDALARQRESYEAVEAAAAAVQRGEVATAEREVARAGELGTVAEEALAACIGSAGS